MTLNAGSMSSRIDEVSATWCVGVNVLEVRIGQWLKTKKASEIKSTGFGEVGDCAIGCSEMDETGGLTAGLLTFGLKFVAPVSW